MTTLLVSVFGVFWLHTVLWWRKDFWERRELRAKGIFFPRHVTRGSWPNLSPIQAFRYCSAFYDDDDLHRPCAHRASTQVLSCALGKRSDAFLGRSRAGRPDPSNLRGHHLWLFCDTPRLYCLLPLVQESRGSPNPIEKLFGPDSLCPRWKDIEDIIGMIRWFLNKGPKPSLIGGPIGRNSIFSRSFGECSPSAFRVDALVPGVLCALPARVGARTLRRSFIPMKPS